MWDALSEKFFSGPSRTEKFTKEELKQRTTDAGKKYILLNLHVESPLDRGKRDFGHFVEKPRLSYML
jgi:hypothetical protein